MICTALNLSNQSAALRRLSPRALQAVKASLLCSTLKTGGIGLNIIPKNATYGGGSTYTLTVLQNTAYTIMWGANDLSMLMGGVTYTSGGAGTKTTVYTKGNTQMVFTGTFAGTTVTAMVKIAVAAVPIPSGFTWSLNGLGTIVTLTWDTPPGNVTATELWTSSDNVTFNLAATVASPGTSTTIAAPAIGATTYAKIRWKNTIATGDFTSVLPVNGVVADWAKRVVTNGGAAPLLSTKTALNTFVSSLVSAGIDSKMTYLVALVPDSLIAAITPLYKQLGNDPATNTGFVAGDLSVNGLQGDAGGLKWLDTGVNPTLTSWYHGGAATGGLSCVYTDGSPAGGSNLIGATNNTAGAAIDLLIIQPNVWAYFYNNAGGGGFMNPATPTGSNFLSASRAIYTQGKVFAGNTANGFQTLFTNNNAAGSPSSFLISMMGQNNNGTFGGGKARQSFAAVHAGLTATETQALFNAVQALRTALGGGAV